MFSFLRNTPVMYDTETDELYSTPFTVPKRSKQTPKFDSAFTSVGLFPLEEVTKVAKATIGVDKIVFVLVLSGIHEFEEIFTPESYSEYPSSPVYVLCVTGTIPQRNGKNAACKLLVFDASTGTLFCTATFGDGEECLNLMKAVNLHPPKSCNKKVNQLNVGQTELF